MSKFSEVVVELRRMVAAVLLVVLVGCGDGTHIDRDGADQVESLVDEILSIERCDYLFALNEDVLVPTDFTPEDEERITTAFDETSQRLQCGPTSQPAVESSEQDQQTGAATTEPGAVEPEGATAVEVFGGLSDGHKVTVDPCAAVSPASSVRAGFPARLNIVLYPRTEAGLAVPGRYSVRVPLDEESTLALRYELRPHDPTMPAWAAPDASLTLGAEEIIAPALAGRPVNVLIEDPFGHEYDTVEVRPGGDGRVELPAGVWRVVPMLPDLTGTLVRCGNGDQQVVLEAGDARPITILPLPDREGRCAR